MGGERLRDCFLLLQELCDERRLPQSLPEVRRHVGRGREGLLQDVAPFGGIDHITGIIKFCLILVL